jgi:hypothetical protein
MMVRSTLQISRYKVLYLGADVFQELPDFFKDVDNFATEISLPQMQASIRIIDAVWKYPLDPLVPVSLATLTPSSSGSTAFTINSHAILWGQLHIVISGLQSPAFDRNAEFIPKLQEGGTILQRRYCYRAAACNGVWNVGRVITVCDDADGADVAPHDLGWIADGSHTTPQ